MARLIDIIPLVKNGWILLQRDRYNNILSSKPLTDVPTVDAVEVVRCKDCKYSGMYAFGDGSGGKMLACLTIEEDGFVQFATSVHPDHFCSYGERKKQ